MGLFLLHTHPPALAPAALPALTANQWLKAILLLVFAYGGFETALAPMAEAKNPAATLPSPSLSHS